MKKKSEESETRYMYVKDAALTLTDIPTLEQAIVIKDRLLQQHPEPEWRVRNRYRSRTGLYDVLVKRRTAVKAAPPPATPAQKQAQRDQKFIANHALTGD